MTHKDFRTNAERKCPECGSKAWKPLGLPGYIGRTCMIAFFGVFGYIIARSSLKRRSDNDPFVLKCEGCGTQWESCPIEAPEEERLEFPCTITITRPSDFVGTMVGQYVYLNGIGIGELKKGGSLCFQTNVKHNILFITDLSGSVFKDYCRFDAESGGSKDFIFNRKFL
jgi:hypothetical protein